jgi:hypothetical protein
METGAINTASPATHSHLWPGYLRDVRMGRKSRLFAHSLPSLGSRFPELEVKIPESLRPRPRIFPFCGDYRRRLVRSRLPPEPIIQILPDTIEPKNLDLKRAKLGTHLEPGGLLLRAGSGSPFALKRYLFLIGPFSLLRAGLGPNFFLYRRLA